MNKSNVLRSFPLSKIQKQFWIISQLEPDSMAYNIPMVYKCSQAVDNENFKQALKQTLIQHTLTLCKVRKKNGSPIFELQNSFEIEDILSITNKTENYNAELHTELFFKDVNSPFNITEDYLVRAHIYNFSNTAIIVLVFHHIIIDLRSKSIFIDELTKRYNKLIDNKGISEDLDFEKILKSFTPSTPSKANARMVEQWKKELSHLPQPPDLQVLKRGAEQKKGNLFMFDLTEEQSLEIREISQQNNLTPFVFLLGAYILLISRISNQNKICTGVPFSNRRNDDVQDSFGCFVNILPLIIDLDKIDNVGDLLNEIRVKLLKTHRIQEVPFIELNEIQERSGTKGLFNVGFTQEYTPIPAFKDNDISLLDIQRTGSQLDLFLTLNLENKIIYGTLEFNSKLYDIAGAERIKELYVSTIQGFLNNYNSTEVKSLSILTRKDRDLIQKLNNTSCKYDKDVCIHEVFERQVEKTPEKTAFVTDTIQLSYRETDLHVNRLANHILEKGIQPGEIIGIACERSIEMMLAILATLKAGCAYLPIQIDAPLKRNEDIISDAKPCLILTTSVGIKNLPSDEETILLDNILDKPLSDNSNKPDVKISSTELAYIIYTSGSTGKPKGTLIEHHSVINRIGWMQKSYPIGNKDVLIQKTPYTFDVSVWELFWWFFNGSTLSLPNPNVEKDPYEILDFIQRHRVTKIHFVPSMFSAFILALDKPENTKKLTSLNTIFFSGESLKATILKQFTDATKGLDSPELVNLYGPTEATVDVSYYNCPTDLSSNTKIFIGKPIDNTGLYIVDKTLNIQPVGIAGELLITGVNLSRGYLNKPELTNKVFIEFTDLNGDKIRAYKTGDIARLEDNHEIEYIGRADNQIKIRGIRVELGEIENVLSSHHEVSNCAVLAESEGANKQLVAYIEVKKNPKLKTSELKGFIEKKLPAHMVPNRIILLKKFPLTTSGKINRKKLSALQPADNTEATCTLPNNSIQLKVLSIWKKTVKNNQISLTQNFFEAGGNSLLAIEITAKVRDEFGVELSPLSIMEYPNVMLFSDYVKELLNKDEKQQHTSLDLDTRSEKRRKRGFTRNRISGK